VTGTITARRRLRRLGPAGLTGAGLLAAIVALAVFGPLLAPHAIDEPIGRPGLPPSASAPLGTDFLGRDVLSRMLQGGADLLVLAFLATALTYLVGISVGMIAGYVRSSVDPLAMRTVDLLLSFPPLLLLLVLLGAAGTGTTVILVGVIVVVAPGVIRVVRTATLTVASRGYVEAAVARGEPTAAILRREILPSIVPVVVADLGIRFGVSVILIASLNYLGLGARPPEANWALMVAENRAVMTTNPWSVLAPGLLLGALTIAVNLIGDAYVAGLGRSEMAA
jgi:ABC-type dipeptide/oligopeptide/nickel transport system permease subunit